MAADGVYGHRDRVPADEKRKATAGALVGGLLVLLLTIATVILLAVVAGNTGSIARDVKTIRDDARDCNTPGAACYDQRREDADLERTRSARVSIAVAQCQRTASANATPSDIEDCVTRAMGTYASPEPYPGG
jgi:hypothetical protein